jgi:hypothetical protein
MSFEKKSIPLEIVTLKGFGVDHDRFVNDIAPTYDYLLDDVYDVVRRQSNFLKNCGKPFSSLLPEERKKFDQIMVARRRAAAKFEVAYEGRNAWSANRVCMESFVQNVSDERAAPRVFAEMSLFVTEHPEFQALLRGVAEKVAEFEGAEVKLDVIVHQVQSVAYRTQPSDNAPEGIHQDGANYIISALVVEERGIRGAMSQVYHRDKSTGEQTLLLRHDLGVGEGILQADSGTELWHDVTPFCLTEGSSYKMGTRSIFGFDIKLK